MLEYKSWLTVSTGEARRHVETLGSDGKPLFSAEVTAPPWWSDLAVTIAASKYMYRSKETSVLQLVRRITKAIAGWAVYDQYMDPESAKGFESDLTGLLIGQYAAFNSPVWFNTGLYEAYGITNDPRESYSYDLELKQFRPPEEVAKMPQSSACFIQSVDDSMSGIMDLAKSEALLFKHGSGTGTNLSSLRSTAEKLSGGGTPSGPVSFMRIFDQVAGAVKSGGKTRRAAKMQILNASHPDIMEFVTCKAKEDLKARALIAQGYSGSFGGEAYDSVMFQNCNTSVAVDDKFMYTVTGQNKSYDLLDVNRKPIKSINAGIVLDSIAKSAWSCGCPGLLFIDRINNASTVAETKTIRACNPCGEFMFIDDSACNLASINLNKFYTEGKLDVESLRQAVNTLIIAQDILVSRSCYPTKEIAKNSVEYRPLGLGYAGLGSVLMGQGIRYGSPEACRRAAEVTQVITTAAYRSSAELAKHMGPFAKYGENSIKMYEVVQQQTNQKATEALTGYRNAQVTLLAPTGTIGFIMDSGTTGIEPELALTSTKQLAGGGSITSLCRAMPKGLAALGYTDSEISNIMSAVQNKRGFHHMLKPGDRRVFDTAMPGIDGTSLAPEDHLAMLAAVQPWLSGGISKTINMPGDCTPEDIRKVYVSAWSLGLKGITVYRDGSKASQPVKSGTAKPEAKPEPENKKPSRVRMPGTRLAVTHKFIIQGHEGYCTVGVYPDGSPGELFITMAKEGSTVGGLMNCFGTLTSIALQYGVPLEDLAKKFVNTRFEPSGFTGNPDIKYAKSILDYIFKWMTLVFPLGSTGLQGVTETREPVNENPEIVGAQVSSASDAPFCTECGGLTEPNGACYRCPNCGASMGCS
jgi:ribonucleoside-diphosphate reductase alpha chain